MQGALVRAPQLSSLRAGGVRYALFGEARFRRAGELLFRGLAVAAGLRIFVTFGHEARQRGAGEFLARGLILAGIRYCNSGKTKRRSENNCDGFHFPTP